MTKRILLHEERYKTAFIFRYWNLLVIPIKKKYVFKNKIDIINKSIILQNQSADLKGLQYTLVCYAEEVYITMLHAIETIKYSSFFFIIHSFALYFIVSQKLNYFIIRLNYFIMNIIYIFKMIASRTSISECFQLSQCICKYLLQSVNAKSKLYSIFSA